MFWIGFNLGLMPAGALARRIGSVQAMAWGGVVAGVGAAGSEHASSLGMLVAAQFVAGAAWAAVVGSAFSTALALGHTGREGRFAGALSSVLALGALVRMSVLAFGLQRMPDTGFRLGWAPVLAWGAAGALMLALQVRKWPAAGPSAPAPR